MITPEEWGKLEVGDVVYFVSVSKMSINSLEVKRIKKTPKKSINFKGKKSNTYYSSCSSEQYFISEIEANFYLKRIAKKTIQRMNEIINKIEGRENGE